MCFVKVEFKPLEVKLVAVGVLLLTTSKVAVP
jgi:hypothetical protein